MLPLRARVDLGTIAMKDYAVFPKLQDYWNLTIRLFNDIFKTLDRTGSYPIAEMWSVYSTAPADLASGWLVGFMLFNFLLKSVF